MLIENWSPHKKYRICKSLTSNLLQYVLPADYKKTSLLILPLVQLPWRCVEQSYQDTADQIPPWVTDLHWFSHCLITEINNTFDNRICVSAVMCMSFPVVLSLKNFFDTYFGYLTLWIGQNLSKAVSTIPSCCFNWNDVMLV